MDRTSLISRAQSNIPLPALMPAGTMQQMPRAKGIMGIGDASATIDPASLTQRLPSIVNPSAVDLSTTCDAFTLWVAANPLLAVGGLAVAAYFLIFNKGKK